MAAPAAFCAGVWQRLHQAMLHRMRAYDQIHWERASVDPASVPSPHGGTLTGRNRTDRGKLGCKHHLIVDQRGLPLVVQISGANVHDSQLLRPLINALPLVVGLSGHPRRRPDKLHADKGYDYACYRRWLRQRGQESRERLVRYRWVVERTIGWLNRYRRLRIRYERRAEIHLAFLCLACALICWRFIQRSC